MSLILIITGGLDANSIAPKGKTKWVFLHDSRYIMNNEKQQFWEFRISPSQHILLFVIKTLSKAHFFYIIYSMNFSMNLKKNENNINVN